MKDLPELRQLQILSQSHHHSLSTRSLITIEGIKIKGKEGVKKIEEKIGD